MSCDSTVPFPYGATVASRAQPSSMPPVATGTVPSFLLPSWQSFTVSRTLHPGIGLLRCLRPPSHTLAFSRPLARQRGRGVPQFQDILRIEIPVAACYRPGAVGTTYRQGSPVGTRHHPMVGQVSQPLAPVRFHGLSSQVPCVSRGIRSGRSTRSWLRVAALLSLGFPPSPVPLLSAGQVDLTPLFMCNLLNRLSLCPVKGRTLPEAGATQERTLEAVRCSARLCQNPPLKVLLCFRQPFACTGPLPRSP
jgi:hypothetical protein